GPETCQRGVGSRGTPLNCNDGTVCTADTCDPVLGCRNTAVANGSPCPDSTVCNGAETCQGGTCTAGTALSCNDSNPCTTDSCDRSVGRRVGKDGDGTSCRDANQ